MSGHSKWSSIKHKKGAADAKRGKLFSKLTRAIIVAAREGGGDPTANLALQNAIEKARVVLDAEGQHRAGGRAGAGADGDGDAYEPIVYEGYGPSGVALIVEALTDNRNRTASRCATSSPSTTGTSAVRLGRVALRAPGLVVVAGDGIDEDELTLAAADGGADDVELDGSSFEISSAPETLSSVREAVEGAGFAVESRRCRARAEDDVAVDDESEARKSPPPGGCPGGERRRPGRLRELRHPRSGSGNGSHLVHALRSAAKSGVGHCVARARLHSLRKGTGLTGEPGRFRLPRSGSCDRYYHSDGFGRHLQPRVPSRDALTRHGARLWSIGAATAFTAGAVVAASSPSNTCRRGCFRPRRRRRRPGCGVRRQG